MMTPLTGELEEFRRIESADVYKAGRHAAKLIRRPSAVEFRYLDEWIDAGQPPVATTLPVRPGPVLTATGALPSYFAGLLPEGRRLGALRRAVKTSADDELSLLLAVGDDTVGDVQIVPSGTSPQEVPPRIAIDDIASTSFADLLDELGIRAQRTALPGVQDKTSAAMINLPIARAGERFILKLNPAEYPRLVENEFFFLRVARTSGFEVPAFSLVTDRDGAHGLLVQRFDRTTADGSPRLLAVEDGCQVTDHPPADKYRLGAEATFSALSAICDAPIVASRELIRRLAHAYLTGNGDAHAKNFSVLQDLSGEWRISPIYDVPTSYVYGDTTMAMAMGARNPADVDGEDFAQLGATLNVPRRAVERALNELAERADRWLDDLETLPFDVGQVRKLRRVVLRRRDRLTARGST